MSDRIRHNVNFILEHNDKFCHYGCYGPKLRVENRDSTGLILDQATFPDMRTALLDFRPDSIRLVGDRVQGRAQPASKNCVRLVVEAPANAGVDRREIRLRKRKDGECATEQIAK